MAIHLCHVPSPPSSLWTAVGGQEEGAVLFKSQFLSSGAVANREQGPWSPSAPAWGTEVVSGARADSVSPRGRLRECV